jgi:Putative beta-barrel porin-2, OmpL-like. bbp2
MERVLEENDCLHPAGKNAVGRSSHWVIRVCGLIIGCALAVPAYAVEPQSAGQVSDEPVKPLSAPSGAPETAASDWHYGAYFDLSYVVNFNFPENHLWRSRGTASRHNELAPNMGYVYVRKDAGETSRWGMEFGLQGGYDSKDFAYLQGEPKVDGADTWRHLQRANVSYLAPVGNGLTVTAGLFNSLIGYESLYAKDNNNYTRSWIADYTPYMMFGVNAKYPVNDRLTVAAFIINGYFHLSRPNDQPSYGGQWSYKITSRLTATQTIYWGPDQSKTALEFWRLYGNHILEWKGDDLTLAASYDIGTESIADQPGSPRTFVMGGNVVAKWHVSGPWSLAVRPEFYWDRNGRWTGQEQFVKAITSTVEYKFPYRWTNTLIRLEYRYDDSTGVGGGFFKGGEVSPGVMGLASTQHLLLLGLLWSFDSP